MKTVNDIRATFLEYFKRHGHEVVPSAPLVPRNDPTLMFTNAGMVPFKNVFTGLEQRPYARAASSQKCVRAGGKHNDLDNVGYTARHHTFFEMLGNFSFGDYFKEGAIELAWNLVTREYGVPEDKLTVTVFHDDDEAFGLWKKIAALPDERIVRIATADNFWSMGETGPCGPCSEIFYDHGPSIAGGPPGTPDSDGDRFVEIWNLVFMQYDQVTPTERVPLPRPCIDTGMGLERIAAVLQGAHDNYRIDLMRRLIDASAELTHVAADGSHAASHRVIADHLRASSFLIADGVLPSNEGRGYVLRRIMRRAMRHAHMIGAKEPLMHRLVPVLVAEMGGAYPELVRAEALVRETLKLEEIRFKVTLERGLRLLDEELNKLGASAALPGDVAFRLYDTYGFPLDLTQDALRAQGRSVDIEGFNAAMARQRAEARKAWAGSGEAATETLWFDLRERVGATEFLGYDATEAEGKVVAIVKDGQEVVTAQAGDKVAIVANQTPFYGESGGQMGDIGVISAEGMQAIVTDTQKKVGDLHVHLARIENGAITVGDEVCLTVDADRRSKLRANHSVTHLLHEALRRVLGSHVTQKGSLVAPDRLRFDISHPKAVSADELDRVEADVNRVIRLNEPVDTRVMTPDDAVKAGALALFGEKYGDEVRVVAMGHNSGDVAPFSVELCGGTHVSRTGDIGYFKIISESAVAAGVRRIEGLTGEAARRYAADQEALVKELAQTLKVSPDQVVARVATLLDERRAAEREMTDLRRKLAMGGGGGEGPAVRDVAGVAFLGQTLDGVPAKELKALADDAKKRLKSGIAAFVAVNDGKAALLVAVTDDLTQRFNAVELVRAGAAAVGGASGGGRPDMAQAGGPDGAKAATAIDAIAKAVADAAVTA
ncbi:MAG: alanine--tRNA ligase [Proteobacteria bacterium]|nr:MAG: alanine--tRNA ligase [Pseudomonadota bacterium]